MHKCIKFILFWNDNLHVSDGLSVHHQEFKTVHTETKQILLSASDSSICLVAVCTGDNQLENFVSSVFLSWVRKKKTWIVFDVHRAVPRNVISIVKPTRCTTVSNLFYFGMTLYTFRTVFPSIIRSSRLYIQQPNRYCCLQADSIICLTNACCCRYSLELLMMDGKTVRNMYSVIPK